MQSNRTRPFFDKRNRLGILLCSAVVASMVWPFLVAPDEPQGPQCADAKGNLTCIEYYGGTRSYCGRTPTTLKGCSSAAPPPELAAACGQLVEGLPGDPTCSQVIVDNPPDPELIKKGERAELRDKVFYWLVDGIFALCGLYVFLALVSGKLGERYRRQCEPGVSLEPAQLPPPTINRVERETKEIQS